MTKILSFITILILFSCGNKEDILLPKSNITLVKDVEDHSPIYIFFRTKDKDTLAALNKKNEIISTNWIFNIDKRLPLRLVIPQIMELQEKKRAEKAHKNELAQNYYSYADSIGKNMAFLTFTKVVYKLEKPTGTVLFFDKNNQIFVENTIVKKEKLQDLMTNILPKNVANKFIFRFDKNLSFGNYIQDKIFLESLKVETVSNEEFIF